MTPQQQQAFDAMRGVNRRLAIDAERYQYLRNHFARAILGAAFSYHATDTGEADLDKVIDDQLDALDEAALTAAKEVTAQGVEPTCK